MRRAIPGRRARENGAYTVAYWHGIRTPRSILRRGSPERSVRGVSALVTRSVTRRGMIRLKH